MYLHKHENWFATVNAIIINLPGELSWHISWPWTKTLIVLWVFVRERQAIFVWWVGSFHSTLLLNKGYFKSCRALEARLNAEKRWWCAVAVTLTHTQTPKLHRGHSSNEFRATSKEKRTPSVELVDLEDVFISAIVIFVQELKQREQTLGHLLNDHRATVSGSTDVWWVSLGPSLTGWQGLYAFCS